MEEDDINLPPAQDSPKNIINILNDDCLQAILLKIELVYDFFRAAEVCTRFQNNAKMCFPFREMKFGYTMSQQQRDEVLFRDAENFLSLFGARIKSIDCYLLLLNRLANDHFLNSITKHCGETLIELKIKYGKFCYFRTPFPILKKLKLNKCLSNNFVPAIIFPELKSLHVRNPQCIPQTPDSTNDVYWLANKFPKLEHVVLNTINSNNYSNFIKFQNHNPQLKSIRTSQSDDVILSIWEDIGERMPNIECLYLQRCKPFEEGMIDIGALPRLKNLNLLYYTDTDISIVKSLLSNSLIYKQPIETLRIEYVDNELGRILQNLKTLKTLYIQRSSEDIAFEFVRHLPALQHLRIYHPNLTTAREILNNVKKLTELQIYIGILSNVNFNLRLYNTIIALATGRVKVIIFYSTVSRNRILNDKEREILFQVSINTSEWVRFEWYYHWGYPIYPNIEFD